MDTRSASEPAEPADEPADLPGAVWDRVVELTAGVLPRLDPVPPSLRRVAAFAPQRRARLGASAIGLALSRDPAFREAVAGRLTEEADAELAGLVAAVTEDAVPVAADPVAQAALVWLLRPAGWSERLPDVVARVADRAAQQQRAGAEAEVGRLRLALAAAGAAQREERTRLRAQAEVLRAENARLRHSLGQARTAARSAREEGDRARAAAADATAAAELRGTAAETELRRLRARVEELEGSAGDLRREERLRRDGASLRARLLLDALVEAGQGLRRELGLPPSSGTPGQWLEEELAGAGPAAPATGAPVSARQLEGWLQLPRARLLVDGYNVSKAAWPDSSLEVQRGRLLTGLAPVVSRTGAETTVVFDAAASVARGPVSPPRGVKVVFSPPGVIADDVLRDLVALEPAGRTVVVVSSDQAVARDVRRAGARPVPAAVLLDLLGH